MLENISNGGNCILSAATAEPQRPSKTLSPIVLRYVVFPDILDRFVEEVEQVRKALNLDKDNFYLLGHSWGGILAMQYALKYQDNLKGLIISDMMSSAPDRTLIISLYAKSSADNK